jgi:hypothetical protein
LFSPTVPAALTEAETAAVKQKLYEKVFGDAVRLDPAMRARVLADEHGKRHYVDTDGDGRPEEVWFIDMDLRHPAESRPLLVRVIDEDGDLREGDQPDLDSDLYIADWKADGSVDYVLDYTDLDRDNDVDEMGMYYYGDLQSYFGEPALRVWWGRDDDDLNTLWHDVGYMYDQRECQDHSHFGGNETILALALPLSGDHWISFWENPFLWYDTDGDSVCEEVVRFSGIGTEVETLRHSFDADDDGTPDDPRDFDVSISAWAFGSRGEDPDGKPGRSDLKFGPAHSETMMLRGFPTSPYLTHRDAREFALQSIWYNAILSWDEVDNNIDGDGREDVMERWEGVIARGTEGFKQIGGPSTGEFNKRYELAPELKDRFQVYYHPADRRLHLAQAKRSWVDVDINFDFVPEARYALNDTDADGIVDTWALDLDLDGKPEDSWTAAPDAAHKIDWTWEAVSNTMFRLHERSAHELYTLDRQLSRALEASGSQTSARPYELAIFSGFEDWPETSATLRTKLLSSDESLRYFLDYLKDRQIAELKGLHQDSRFWKAMSAARALGDYTAMSRLVETEFKLGPLDQDYAMWTGELRRPATVKLVDWSDQLLAPNLAWESEQMAFRTYFGQFDFFGKRGDRLVLAGLGSASYHADADWGMDCLHVGEGPGCGGLTLYVNDVAYPAFSPNGVGSVTFSHELIEATNEKIVLRMTARNVGPAEAPYQIEYRIHALAGRADSPVEVTVSGGKPTDRIQLAIGISRLKQETPIKDQVMGILANWGEQMPEIGEIGQGILYPPQRFVTYRRLELEDQVLLQIKPGEPLTYNIQCAWQRGMRFDRSPGPREWLTKLRQTAANPARP